MIQSLNQVITMIVDFFLNLNIYLKETEERKQKSFKEVHKKKMHLN